ncbi:MAG: methionyl-tRNA formyltransferase [Alphaproteobacteria bacterium]|nr:methionyl-tRNA formyltransferase [Alphaproteobacteria bacterium]
MRIIFMGSPVFALPTLELLVDSAEHDVVAVYTQPPRPAGRGYKLQPCPVHEAAQEHGIPVFCPASLKSEEEQAKFRDLKADVAVVVAYGLLLPKPILEGTTYGCLNIHPSLLPRWRGAAPIQRTLMAGDEMTAIAIMKMDEGLDTGDVMAIEEVPLADDTFPQLHDILAFMGAKLMLEVLRDIDKLEPQPQATEGVTYAHKIRKEEAEIDWRLDAKQIDCLIRALTPSPGAFFRCGLETIKILEARYQGGHFGKPGTVIDDQLSIACGSGMIQPLVLQRAGKQAMDLERFLRGFSIKPGTVLVLDGNTTVH